MKSDCLTELQSMHFSSGNWIFFTHGWFSSSWI